MDCVPTFSLWKIFLKDITTKQRESSLRRKWKCEQRFCPGEDAGRWRETDDKKATSLWDPAITELPRIASYWEQLK